MAGTVPARLQVHPACGLALCSCGHRRHQAASRSICGGRGVEASTSRARATPAKPTWRVARLSRCGIRPVDDQPELGSEFKLFCHVSSTQRGCDTNAGWLFRRARATGHLNPSKRRLTSLRAVTDNRPDWRYGITVPFGDPLHAQADLYREFADLGYTEFWSSEADGTDGFTPLVLASQWVPDVRLGIAIIPAFTRGPGHCWPSRQRRSAKQHPAASPWASARHPTSSSSAGTASRSTSRSSAPATPFGSYARPSRASGSARPTTRSRCRVFASVGLQRSNRRFSWPHCDPGMLRLAGSEGDGAIINWLSADDVSAVRPYVDEGGEGKEVVARIFVCPNPDARGGPRAGFKRAIAAYLNVPVYAEFHRWLGRGELLAAMWERWSDGDRRGALEVIDDDLVDELLVHGPPDACREHIDRYHANGVDVSAISIMPFGGIDPVQAARDLSPDSPQLSRLGRPGRPGA